MLNRRLIRVKVFQAFYAYDNQENEKGKIKSYLLRSLKGIEDTFFNVLLFPYEFTHFMNMEFNQSSSGLRNNSERRVAAQKLSGFELWKHFESTPEIKDRIEKPRHNWQIDKDFMRSMVKVLLEESFFRNYVLGEAEEKTTISESQFLIEWLEYLCQKNEDFHQQMENLDMHWEDEKAAVLQSIKKLLKDGGTHPLPIPAVSTDWEEDSGFAMDLFDCAVASEESYSKIISEYTPDWEVDRIAKTDMQLMVLALCEFTKFPYIPLKVSMNEYLELAKRYSTPQSSKFINGVLDKLMKKLQAENKIIKKGRGLLE